MTSFVIFKKVRQEKCRFQPFTNIELRSWASQGTDPIVSESTHTHTHTHSHKHTHKHIYIYIYSCVYMCSYACVRVCMRMSVYLYKTISIFLFEFCFSVFCLATHDFKYRSFFICVCHTFLIKHRHAQLKTHTHVYS